MNKNVLGVSIDDISEDEAIDQVSSWLNKYAPKSSKQLATKLVFTPGPEFIVEAQRDLEFKEILNASDLNIPDGYGLKFAGISNRIPGLDFMFRLCQEAQKNGWTIGLLGGWEGEAQETASELLRRYPKLKIPLRIDGEEADRIASEWLNSRKIDNSSEIKDREKGIEIMESGNKQKKTSFPDVEILFVAMGHFRQEKLLSAMRAVSSQQLAERNNYLLSAICFRVGMGVGSSFDEITGRIKTGPKWLSKFGLKWLGRLTYKPRHFRRVMQATFGFWWELLRK